MNPIQRFLFAVLKQISKPFIGSKTMGRFPFLRIFYTLAWKLVKPKENFLTLQIQGCTMRINSNDVGVTPYLLMNKVYDETQTRLIRGILSPGQVFLDIGANFGYYTMIAARKVGATGKVYSFEPAPMSIELLEQNILLNKFENVSVEQVAVADRSGTANLYIHKNNLGNNTLTSKVSENTVPVEQITIDEFYYKGPVHLVKIDVEGSEILVLKGMQDTMARNKHMGIVIEYCPTLVARQGFDYREVENILKEFEIFIIDDSKKKIMPASFSKIHSISKGDMAFNLYCSK